MERSEYIEKLNKLTNDFNENVKSLKTEFGLSISPYKIGDVVTDHWHTIRIQRVKVLVNSNEPDIVYIGLHLKKDGTPYKDQTNNVIYLRNVKNNNNKESKKC